jgi:membrane protein DedA with SNARE-associated domain
MHGPSSPLQGLEAGVAPVLTTPAAEREASLHVPFGLKGRTPASGVGFVIHLLVIALATLLSEDLACIGAGMLAARGVIGFVPATAAALAGILAGDLLLFAAGRFFGHSALQAAPMRWLLKADDVEHASAWFETNGPKIIFGCRFVPGSRLPVYFAAGIIGGNLWSLLFYFIIAAALWTPALVGLGMWAGGSLLAYYSSFHHYALWLAVGGILGLYVALRLVKPLFSFRGRRVHLSRFQRMRRWEFWPVWLLYLPAAAVIIRQGIHRRCLTLFTAVNPGIAGGGLAGESKSKMLKHLLPSGRVAPYLYVGRSRPMEWKIRTVMDFMAERQIDFPVVCKPDAGRHGRGIKFVNSRAQLKDYLLQATTDTLVQQYIPGHDCAVFYYRYPGRGQGHILAVTDKRLISVTGDGRSTLERLILNEPWALFGASLHLQANKARLHAVPPAGEKVQLVQVGTHALGALLLDGSHLITPAMERGFDALTRHFKGFYFGRFNVRADDLEAFRQGRGFKVLAFNGVASETAGIHDPTNTLLNAWRLQRRQWKIAIEIGAANVENGVQPLTISQCLKLAIQRNA